MTDGQRDGQRKNRNGRGPDPGIAAQRLGGNATQMPAVCISLPVRLLSLSAGCCFRLLRQDASEMAVRPGRTREKQASVMVGMASAAETRPGLGGHAAQTRQRTPTQAQKSGHGGGDEGEKARRWEGEKASRLPPGKLSRSLAAQTRAWRSGQGEQGGEQLVPPPPRAHPVASREIIAFLSFAAR